MPEALSVAKIAGASVAEICPRLDLDLAIRGTVPRLVVVAVIWEYTKSSRLILDAEGEKYG